MIKLGGMLMIGSTGCNTGKTRLACEFFQNFSKTHNIVGIKVTPITDKDGQHPPSGNCKVRSSLDGAYLVIEETNPHSKKDTARFLYAGASRVFWLRVFKERLQEGLKALLDVVGPDAISICESNLLRHVVEPGLFLMVAGSETSKWKNSALELQEHTDRMVFSENGKFDFDYSQVRILDGRWALQEKATVIVMAGGASQRMGIDKSMLPMNGQSIIENICEQLHGSFQQILISANDTDKFAFLGYEVIQDRLPGQGPLMGIASALAASANELNFIVACDIPHIRLPFIRKMLSLAARSNADIVVPMSRDGLCEPLYAVYRKSVLDVMNEALSRDRRKLSDVFARCQVEYVELKASLPNLNTIFEYQQFQKQLTHYT